MRVSKAQAQESRTSIVETASVLFRERGYDGVGVADLMSAAGFTHGGFYKHFRAKADLMAEASANGLSQTVLQAANVDATEFVQRYVSRDHRDARKNGCTLAALGGDAARQSDDVKATFAAGIEGLLAAVQRTDPVLKKLDEKGARAKMINVLAHSVGAMVLSRACPNDSSLAEEILTACRSELLATLSRSRPRSGRGKTSLPVVS